MAIKIQVKLDTTANPPVTTVPVVQSVNSGNNQIEWTPFAQESFTFVSLTGLPNPPFRGLNVTSPKITVNDGNSAAASYQYTITVSSGGNTYSSNATISADPPRHGRVTPMPIGGGADSPTIKNN